MNDFVLVFVDPKKSRKASSKHVAAEESKRQKCGEFAKRQSFLYIPIAQEPADPPTDSLGQIDGSFCKHWRKPDGVESFFDARSEKNGVQSFRAGKLTCLLKIEVSVTLIIDIFYLFWTFRCSLALLIRLVIFVVYILVRTLFVNISTAVFICRRHHPVLARVL